LGCRIFQQTQFACGAAAQTGGQPSHAQASRDAELDTENSHITCTRGGCAAWTRCRSSLPRRFANPTALNAAAGWLFVNDPENVQYLCSTNVRNYQRRYLPDIYKWVTHEKGILGSQVRLFHRTAEVTFLNGHLW